MFAIRLGASVPPLEGFSYTAAEFAGGERSGVLLEAWQSCFRDGEGA